MAFIQSIGLAPAPFRHAQKDILQFMLQQYDLPLDHAEKIQRLYHRSEIDFRHSVLEDFSLPETQWTLLERGTSVSLEKRMACFFRMAPILCEQAIRNCMPEMSEWTKVTHLITVSCTGLSAPGLDIQLIQQLSLPTDIQRSAINFMGCYAGIHALKQADAICKSNPAARVLIVDVELCTLHFQTPYTLDNVAASLLFADGAAAVLISNESGYFSIEDYYSEVALGGYDDMSWQLSSEGFLMSLSGYVPSIIAENITPMLQHALEKHHLKKEEIRHWAIHPGGKKIVSELARALSLSEADTAMSRSILREYGNMSSVTIFYVLDHLRRSAPPAGERVLALAFGPGLTIESIFLRTC